MLYYFYANFKIKTMKKTILFIILSITPILYADYRIYFPLEIQNGGHLNKNSILFKKDDNEPKPIEYTTICDPIETVSSFWREATSIKKATIFWRGESIVAGISSDLDSYKMPDGTIYKKSSYFKTVSSSLVFYRVCQLVEKYKS